MLGISKLACDSWNSNCKVTNRSLGDILQRVPQMFCGYVMCNIMVRKVNLFDFIIFKLVKKKKSKIWEYLSNPRGNCNANVHCEMLQTG